MTGRRAIITVAIAGLMLCSNAFGAFIQVPGQSEIFSAGQAAPGSSGVLPPSFVFTPGSVLSITFTSVTGTVNFCNGCVAPIGPDGTVVPGYTGTNIACSLCGLSGVRFDGRQMFLVGVFLDESSVPSGANPVNFLNYDDTNSAAASYSPGLNQIFYIGDGQGTSGAQSFVVPGGAGRLFLGFADGTPLFGAPGAAAAPSAYGDNEGQLDVNFDAVNAIPEPGTITLFALGLAAIVVGRKRFV
jgi:hypothetical protein